MKIQVGINSRDITPTTDKDGVIVDGVFFDWANIEHEERRMEEEQKRKFEALAATRRSEPDITWLRKHID